MDIYEKTVKGILFRAGISVGGSNDFDITVHHHCFYKMVVQNGPMGIGDSFVKGYWSSSNLEKTIIKFSHAGLDSQKLGFFYLMNGVFRKLSDALQIKSYYDKGYLLYKSFLDERMIYSCGYWNNIDYSPANLNLAQEQKLELICRKLGLHRQPRGQKILDTNCCFGGFAKYASEKYDARVTGLTLSRLHYRIATAVCRGLPVEIRFQDYKNIPENEKYDHIVSDEMFEYLGRRNYRGFILKMKQHLKHEEHEENFFLLQTVFTRTSSTRIDPWLKKTISPGAEIPTEVDLYRTIHDIFVCEDFHDFLLDYPLTIKGWSERLEINFHELDLKKYQNPEFKRACEYCFKFISACFFLRKNDVVQMLLSHNGILGGQAKIRKIF